MLMFAVLSAGMLTGLTATGMSLGQTAFAHEGKKYNKDQTIDQENHCKIVISNEHGDEVRQNDNDNHLTCQTSLKMRRAMHPLMEIHSAVRIMEIHSAVRIKDSNCT
jgi:hypothetical protein